MLNTTRNAPFGTDNTPELNVKIVGGRQIEILRNGTGKFQNEDLPREISSYPRPGPHGTPPILTQPIWSAYDRKSEVNIDVNATQYHSKRQGTYTQPFGDRSYSFQHGRKVLPPIPQRNITVIRSTDDLENQVSDLLQNYDIKNLKNMYNDLASQDASLSGLASDTQVSLSALKHNLPLTRSTLQLVMSRFLNSSQHDLINYEEMLKFLSKCKKEKLHSSHNITAQNYDNEIKSRHSRSKTSPAVLMLTSAPYKHRDEITENGNHTTLEQQKENIISPAPSSKLVQLLAANMEVDDMDLTNLRSALKELDRLQSGELPAHVIRTNLIKYRIPLTGSLIDKILEHAETKHGLVDWRLFMDHIITAQNTQHGVRNQTSIVIPNSPKQNFTQKSTEKSRAPSMHESVKSNLPWERLPLKSITHDNNLSTAQYSFRSVESGTSVSLDLITNDDDSETTISTSASSRLQLPQGWDERESIVKDAAIIDAEPWLHKFNKLTHALKTYQPGQPDILPHDVAERVTKNYNLIYGLGFSEKKIDAALQQTMTRSNKTDTKLIPIQELLDVLSGKKRLIT